MDGELQVLGVFEGLFELALRCFQLFGQSVEHRAYQPALGVDVVVVLAQRVELRHGLVGRFALLRVVQLGGYLVVYTSPGSAGPTADISPPVSSLLELRALEIP
ncbi:hypothetical protein BLA24_08305 [Streptomyces cinnamoneus]|uniref:Uncharacterized protein n=1 Tax=Streptomyces cinnamoneus TaxID=53446 RepID=A0A2G1XME4_STRCJ|nr:hypothetical protein [Streptomyces cinnamoneus]PHQ52309.1 hypothetical protein BLA24_08305 [Streptomyces cinnamoneus]